MSSGLTYDEKMNFKKMGILAQKQNGYYTIRFLSKVGYFEADEIVALSNIAKKYGNGEVSLTSRLTVEIPYIEEKNIEKVLTYAKENELRIGGAGKTVRAVIACKGNVCIHGLIDTRKLGNEIEDKFFGKKLIGKFKIGVFGCINSYGKAQSNDLSIMPTRNLENSNIVYLIFLGGRLGRNARLAKPMERIFKRDELMNIIESTIEYYDKNANKNERFAELIERVSLKEVENSINKIFDSK